MGTPCPPGPPATTHTYIIQAIASPAVPPQAAAEGKGLDPSDDGEPQLIRDLGNPPSILWHKVGKAWQRHMHAEDPWQPPKQPNPPYPPYRNRTDNNKTAPTGKAATSRIPPLPQALVTPNLTHPKLLGNWYPTNLFGDWNLTNAKHMLHSMYLQFIPKSLGHPGRSTKGQDERNQTTSEGGLEPPGRGEHSQHPRRLRGDPMLTASSSSQQRHILPPPAPTGALMHPHLQFSMKIAHLQSWMPWIAAASISWIVIMMYPGSSNSNNRTPPSWGPELGDRYPFRTWARDVMIWSILTDLDSRRKCAAVILQLRGGAQELARQMPPQAIIHGGIINGTAVDAMTFLMHKLTESYSQLGEETRLSALTDLMSFDRNGREPIDQLIIRFDTVRQRANQEGQLTLSVQGLVWILLKACRINDQQLMTLLQPFGGLFPSTNEQYTTLLTHLRRMGHIIERAPGNLASQLRGHGRDGAQNAFFTGMTDTPDPGNQWAMDFGPPAASYPAYGAPQPSMPQQQQQPLANTTNTAQAYPAMNDEDSGNGTDTDTASSCGMGELEFPPELPATATQEEIGQVLWATYDKAKSNWRRFNNKPVRAVRRFVRRKGKGSGKSKGPGKGKRVGTYLAELSDQEVDSIFLGKGKKGGGKGFNKGKRSTGFGKGRRGNPLDKDGNVMRCHNCQSTEHLIAQCPSKGSGKGAAVQMFASQTQHTHHTHTTPADWEGAFHTHDAGMYEEGPLAGLLGVTEQPPEHVHQIFMNTQTTGSSQAADLPAPPPQVATPATDPWMMGEDPWLQRLNAIATEPMTEPSPQVLAEDVPVPPDVMHHHMPTSETPWTIQPSPAEIPSWAQPAVLGDTLGFSNQVDPSRVAAITTVGHIFGGAYGPAPSTLEAPHQPLINNMAQTHATLDDWYNGGDTPVTPNITTTSALDGQHHSLIDEFWYVQQENEQRLNKGKQKGKGKGAQTADDIEAPTESAAASTPRRQESEVEFDGDDRMCSICLEEFEGGDRVLRLACRHLFHIHCWNDLLIRTDEATESCPNCRGSARIAARFRYIAPPVVAYQEPNDAAPTMTTNSSATSFHSVFMMTGIGSQVLMINNTEAQRVLHSSTALPDGRLSIIVDVGAWKNLFGRKLVRQAAEMAIAAGYRPKQWKMDTPLRVQGIGNGTQECVWEIRLPIAAEDGSGETHVHSFDTPIVEGTGEDVPGLLGLKSIREKKGILETEPGKEMLTFPGPGGYEITFAPGYQQFKLEQAPSGHLVIPISDFGKVKKPSGVPPPKTAFHAIEDTGEQSFSTSSSSATEIGARIGTSPNAH